jgi:chemotaxis response regulator CheB
MVRILIADDHEVVRSGLRRLIAAQANWEVVAEASDGRDAIKQAVATMPDVAILDYAMPLRNGIETTREIRARLPSTEVLIFSLHDGEKGLVQRQRLDCLQELASGGGNRPRKAALPGSRLNQPVAQGVDNDAGDRVTRSLRMICALSISTARQEISSRLAICLFR